MASEFIKTHSALNTGIKGFVALWNHDTKKVYFCKSEHYVYPGEIVGVNKDNILYETDEKDLFYIWHEGHEKDRERVRKILIEKELEVV